MKVVPGLVAGLCIANLSLPSLLFACAGSAGFPCLINPGVCLKSMVLAKAAPAVVVLPPGGPASFNVPMNLFITCPTTNYCGGFCPNPGLGVPLTPSSIVVNLYPGPCSPGAILPPPTITASISTGGGTMTPPTCSSAGEFNAHSVPVTVPAGTLPGLYCVVGTATVTFPDGLMLTQTGDTVVCLVNPSPAQPELPPLDLQLISPPIVRAAPGEMAVASYLVRNNGPTALVLTVTATSRQSAVRPQGANESQGVFAISNPFGDDFPIVLNPTTNCIPLPEHPYTQFAISNAMLVIPPGGTNIVTVGIRSYGQCASGSSSESTLTVAGTFADSSPALACAGMALIVDTAMPSTPCARAVNDCNQNGIPDALDIAARRSADQNFNALPDECEQLIITPLTASATPANPAPGAPLQVQIAFNENVDVPMVNVWANGSSLTRTQSFGFPVWLGTIPADTRPGPQTVYFLGRDQRGGLSTYIALYTVAPPPRITRIYFDGSRNAIIEHNGVQIGRSVFVQENLNLSCPTCWTNRPSGPHSSPYNAGPATGIRFFRLHD